MSSRTEYNSEPEEYIASLKETIDELKAENILLKLKIKSLEIHVESFSLRMMGLKDAKIS